MSDASANAARVAIVTGAAQGIGEAIALRFARDGFDLALVDLPAKQEQLDAVVKAVEALGARATAVFGDTSLEADVVKYVEKTVQQFGGVDVMVANAGIFSYKPILELSVEEFDNVMGVNARGLMLAIKHAGRQMVKQGRGGRIIAAASYAAKTGIMNSSAYSASKFATRGLVQSAALELRQHKITVNAYAPGLIITPLTTHPDDEKNGGPASTGLKNAGMPQDMKAGTAEDVAELVAYLAKPEAWYVTGQCININGGIAMD
ncbi:NAD-P-binding protein [Trametes versicolor FP-101664 SS1]|uniref:NAD-P-binding protein n=1 Tax=Trametes versicolor (strain FP-101664) TaxID=717944 RepID=UPI00046247C7|nr:NAD-P-binding protein [Trametes versicolor FP-101664 SS1]EIW60776.1 NAD-P-binding protein [Trametes versicolor FP-101664 SS1]